MDMTNIQESISYFLDHAPIPRETPWLALTIVLAPLKSELNKGPALGFCLKAIPTPPEHCTVLACHHARRTAPDIKSTSWIQERKSLEAMKDTEYNEVLLVDNGLVYEGLSSNFAVITDKGTLQTAPNTLVLAGTVMAMIKEVAAELGIGIEEDCPDIKGVGSWRAAFITSTSRLLLPISQLCIDG
jgi:branched-subunit amino acid aminotransferase/4-amino-4-deoxychorismate lyase